MSTSLRKFLRYVASQSNTTSEAYMLTTEQGSYNVEAKVRTKDDELVTCLTADITFHR